MDEEIENRLAKIEQTVLGNKKILNKLLSYRRWEMFYSVIRFIIFMVIAFGLYYYLQPYLDQLFQVYTNLNDVMGGFNFPLGKS